jgi:hypothetical protein
LTAPDRAEPLDEPAVELPAEQRKVVSVPFWDLVGFTATAEGGRPEGRTHVAGAVSQRPAGDVEASASHAHAANLLAVACIASWQSGRTSRTG